MLLRGPVLSVMPCMISFWPVVLWFWLIFDVGLAERVSVFMARTFHDMWELLRATGNKNKSFSLVMFMFLSFPILFVFWCRNRYLNDMWSTFQCHMINISTWCDWYIDDVWSTHKYHMINILTTREQHLCMRLSWLDINILRFDILP